MAWLCNDPATTKTFSNIAAIVSGLWQNTGTPPVEPVGYKGASMSRSPGAVRCTWVPLGVLAAEFCGRAPKKTHRQQMASVVFHPAMRLLLTVGYKTHWATETQRSLRLSQADMWRCLLTLQIINKQHIAVLLFQKLMSNFYDTIYLTRKFLLASIPVIIFGGRCHIFFSRNILQIMVMDFTSELHLISLKSRYQTDLYCAHTVKASCFLPECLEHKKTNSFNSK